MKVYPETTPRDEYLAAQIARSRAKFNFCKVSPADVALYRRLVPDPGEILCLGVRNGTEVDRFRLAYEGGRWPWSPRRPVMVQGVEINPDAIRPDVLIASFDDLPRAFVGMWGLVFSNSLDHALDVVATARHWRTMVRPGGHVILALPEIAALTVTDRVALDLEDVRRLFAPATLVYYHHEGSVPDGYTQIVLRLPP